jgi:SAM-dependent methyltransferase
MCAIILDLEDAIKKAAPISGARRYGDRVQHRVGDALSDDLGIELYDLILISNLAHHFTNQQNRALIRRAAQALVSGGILVILEPIRPRSATSINFQARAAFGDAALMLSVGPIASLREKCPRSLVTLRGRSSAPVWVYTMRVASAISAT